MNELPSITVITPSYNQGRFIRQTIESVFSQHYPKLEYIIVDGASTDETQSILKEYGDRVIIISERDGGQTDAINKGLRLATSDIICWLNSDDYFLPNGLLTVGEFFKRNPNKIWMTGDCLIVNESGQPIQQPIRWYKRILRTLGPIMSLDLTNAVCQPATFWRRTVHDQVGLLNESLHYTMDYDFWLRLRQIQRPECLVAPLAVFRIHKNSKGGKQYQNQFAEDEATFKKYAHSNLFIWLHKSHNKLIISIYRILKATI